MQQLAQPGRVSASKKPTGPLSELAFLSLDGQCGSWLGHIYAS
jgi:hypothetical protein